MNDIDRACAAFRTLLTEQQARVAGMTAERVDYTKKATVTIGLVDGDGIGPIIMEQAVRVLEALLADEIARGSIALRRIRGLTIENRLACNQAVPDDVLSEILACDVLLKGPTTTPMGGGLESANVKLRRALDLYANVRPVTIPEQGIDWTFFRENTEGEYALVSRGVELPGMPSATRSPPTIPRSPSMITTSTLWRRTSSTSGCAGSFRCCCCRTSTATSSPTRPRSCRAASARRAAPTSATATPCSRPSMARLRA